MKAAEMDADFNLTAASKSVHEFTRKRILVGSGGRAEAVLLLAHRNEKGEKAFRFFGIGEGSTVLAKNVTIQAAYKSSMEQWYKVDDERQEAATKAGRPPPDDDFEVHRFLKGLGSGFVPYITKFQEEQFTMEPLKLANDENFAALQMPMGLRIRLLAAIAAHHKGKARV